MSTKFLTFIFTVFLTTSAYAHTTQPVDCNKAASMAAASVFKMYEGKDSQAIKSAIFATLPEASKKAGLNEAELIVATGIVANVSVFGAKQIYSDLDLTKAAKERKLHVTRNVFYMFCQNAFRAKEYY